MKVKVNHTGSCDGHFFTKDVVVELPDEVLEALGEDSYEEIEEEKSEKVAYKDLQARAKELGINSLGKKTDELISLITEAEKEDK